MFAAVKIKLESRNIDAIVLGIVASLADRFPPAPAPAPQGERWLTLREVEARTGMSPSSVTRRIRSGELPSQKFGRSRRVREADVSSMGATK